MTVALPHVESSLADHWVNASSQGLLEKRNFKRLRNQSLQK